MSLISENEVGRGDEYHAYRGSLYTQVRFGYHLQQLEHGYYRVFSGNYLDDIFDIPGSKLMKGLGGLILYRRVGICCDVGMAGLTFDSRLAMNALVESGGIYIYR